MREWEGFGAVSPPVVPHPLPPPMGFCASQTGSEVLEAPERSQGDPHSWSPGKNKYLLENSELFWKVVAKKKDSSYLELAQALRSPSGVESGKGGRDVSKGEVSEVESGKRDESV